MIDLMGNKYGRLSVIGKAERPYYWKCRCECGAEKEVRGDHLRKGRIVSCGCYNREKTRELGKVMSCLIAGKNRIDITGKRFGSLTAVKVTKVGDRFHSETWLCKCDCGAEQEVCKSNLLSGHTTSCGCGMSRLEKRVAEILTENGFKFTKNKTFASCKSESGTYAKFDFYVENHYIIECDGKQHEMATGTRFTQERHEYIKAWDEMKNAWCAEHDVPIIRIPSDHMNDLTIDDLIPGKSRFTLRAA